MGGKTGREKTGEKRLVGKDRGESTGHVFFFLQNSIIRRILFRFQERSLSMSLFEEILQN